MSFTLKARANRTGACGSMTWTSPDAMCSVNRYGATSGALLGEGTGFGVAAGAGVALPNEPAFQEPSARCMRRRTG